MDQWLKQSDFASPSVEAVMMNTSNFKKTKQKNIGI